MKFSVNPVCLFQKGKSKVSYEEQIPLFFMAMAALVIGDWSARATTIIWTNTAGGSFGNAANWSPNSVPGSGDLAVITNTGTYTVTLDTGRTVSGIQLGANSGVGTQTFSMNANALISNGSTIINTNGVFIVSAGLNASGINLTNNGTVTWTAGAITDGDAGVIYNNGLWDAQGNNIFQYNNSGTGPVFNNAGIFRKSAGGGTTTFASSTTFNNTGTNDVQNGTMSIVGGGANTAPGVFNTANGAALTFDSSYGFNTGSQFTGTGDIRLVTGTFTLSGNITFTKLTQTGGTLAGTHVLNGIFTFSAGTWATAGNTTIASGSTLLLTNGTFTVSGRILTNNGTVTWVAGTINDGDAGVVYNNGLWDAQGNNIFQYNNSGTGPVFNNRGIFRKSAGGGTTAFAGNTTFNNTGTNDVQNGTMSIAGGGSNTSPGVFNTTNGAAVNFNADYTFNDGTKFTGSGTNLLASGNFTLSGNITFTKLTQTGGTLFGNHVLNGIFTFGGGLWNTSGGTIIASGSILVIASGLNASGRFLTNNGTVTWTAGAITDGDAGAIYNNGLWDAQTDSSFNYNNSGTPAVFNNAGIFRKSAGTGTTTFDGSTTFNNTGTNDVQTGTVSLIGPHSLTGGTINIGISSLSNFGKVSLSGASGFTGKFSANLNGGYIPITNNAFAVITYASLSGTFGNYSLPFADAWTNIYSPTTFSLYVFNARPIPPSITNQIVNELTLLTVTNTAVDLDIPTNTLTYTLLAPPAGASINGSGVITWIPNEAQGPNTNLITTVVTDNGLPVLSATNSFSVVVNEINVPPVLSPLANTNVNELTTLTLTNSATDSDIPANSLTYVLLNAPTGAAIDTNGVITWTPTEAQGPSTNTFTTVVMDTNIWAVNTQSFTVTNTFTVVANEVNVAPVLAVPASTSIDELTNYSANATATDTDIPINALTFSLVSGPAGLTVSSGGLINWTPTEAQGPGTNTVIIRVADFNPWAVNATSLSATNSYQIIVNEVNVAPVLPVLANTNIIELVTLSVTNTATDSDLPANPLTYLLLASPSGAAIDANGVITWTPTEVQGPSTITFTTVVTDTNIFAVSAKSLSTTNTFTVVANEVNVAPVLASLADTNINEGGTLTVTNTATDTDIPANALTYTLLVAPAGATIDTSGVITWPTVETNGPGTFTFTTKVADTNVFAVTATSLSATNTFTVTVNELNVAPVLTLPADQTINELDFYTNNATATDADIPTNALTFALVSGPSGLTVSTIGAITWTPSEAQGPGSYLVRISVTDTNPAAVNTKSFSVSNSFTLTVNEVNVAPVLGSLTDRAVNPGQTISFTATATDADLPANTLTFTLVSPPSGATINSSIGLFNWRPAAAEANTTNVVQVRVADNGTPNLSDLKSFKAIVNPLSSFVLTNISYTNGQFLLQVSGPSGPDYIISASTNLLVWRDVLTNPSPRHAVSVHRYKRSPQSLLSCAAFAIRN
jgi:hypothetical protein